MPALVHQTLGTPCVVPELLGVSTLLEFKDEMSQAVMKPVGAEGYDYTYVIMPMRV